MSISGNTLAKYLIMMSQVIAWCTVSVMLLRRGLHQVHAQQPALYDKANGTVDDSETATSIVAAGSHHHEAAKSLDETGTPAVVAGVVMITIAVIMLIISPTIMLMKIIEKRKRRIMDAELESPPKYEDVVESAPRYSSLFVFNNDGEMTLVSENVEHCKEKDNNNIQNQFV